jgi:hypothetical protein
MAQQITNNNSIPSGLSGVTNKQKEAIRNRIVKTILLKAHIITYLIVNLILFAINNFLMISSYQWYLWSVTGWGLGLAIHIFAFSVKSPGLMSYHLFLYIAVNALLIFIDWFTDKTLNWFFWPLLGWGIGLLFHGIAYMIYRPMKDEDPNKSWMERKIEAELKVQGNSPEPDNINTTIPIPRNVICPQCKTSNPLPAKFCANCGQSIII